MTAVVAPVATVTVTVPVVPATPSMATVKGMNPFDPEGAAQGLRSAMRGLGTDEDAIIKIIALHTNKQRQDIKLKYRTMFGRDLETDLRDELSDDFLRVVKCAMALPAVYDARELRKAMQGAGTNESVLTEILATRTNVEIEAIKHVYKQEYKTPLAEAIDSETSGDFRQLLQSLLQGYREEFVGVSESKAQEDARRLLEAGEKRLGTDEAVFNKILSTSSIPQLQATFRAYATVSGHDIERAIESETSGDAKDAYLALVRCVKNRGEYFAELLYKAMKGLGTDDDQLIRVIITRSEIDLAAIKKAFYFKYSTDLRTYVQDDCSGDYCKFLLYLID